MATPAHHLYRSLTEGQVIGPQYHRFSLSKKISDSPLGQFWLAEDLSVQGAPAVTLELINPDIGSDNASLEAIKRQVSYGKKLRHKHTLQVHGLFTTSEQLNFISTEPLDGTSLSSLLREGKTKLLSDNQIKGLLLQSAAALDTAGSTHHLIHASLCPALIYINRGTGVKLTGFGINGALNAQSEDTPHTERYTLYQAPEIHQGGKPNRQSDVYSLACISYETFTGRPPFAATDDPSQCDPTRLIQPHQLSELQWEQLQAALSFSPNARPVTALALVKALFQPESDTPPAPTDKALTEEETTPVTMSPTVSDAHIATRDDTTAYPTKNKRWPSFLTPKLLGTFMVGLVVGYLASLIFPTYVEKPTVLAETPLDQIAPQQETPSQVNHDAEDPLVADQTDPPQTEPETAKTEPAPTIEQLLAETGTPRNLMFRDQIRSQIYGPDMIALPLGRFKMGDNHKQGDDNEYPVHPVSINHTVALSRYEITFTQYDRFAKSTRRPMPDDEGWGRGTRPVINISWKDAYAYSRWLAEQTGQPYRLPTEAEWEYAARAGTQSTFWWGNTLKAGYAVCDECGSPWDGTQTAPVGSVSPNPWGLYDMAGNVSEWVADCYQPDYQGAPNNGSALSTTYCDHRVMRGGSWFDIVRLMRPAGRYRHLSTATQNDWGFRVALDLPQALMEKKE